MTIGKEELRKAHTTIAGKLRIQKKPLYNSMISTRVNEEREKTRQRERMIENLNAGEKRNIERYIMNEDEE